MAQTSLPNLACLRSGGPSVKPLIQKLPCPSEPLHIRAARPLLFPKAKLPGDVFALSSSRRCASLPDWCIARGLSRGYGGGPSNGLCSAKADEKKMPSTVAHSEIALAASSRGNKAMATGTIPWHAGSTRRVPRRLDSGRAGNAGLLSLSRAE